MMKKWTAKDIPDLEGKVIIVTGGNSGLGYASVKAFAANGAQVIMACRSVEKGELAKAQMEELRGDVEVMALDLAQPASIRDFAKVFMRKYKRLDVLLNNAGVMRQPYELSPLGIESQLSINHLGHFMLTSRLLDVIVKTPRARIVSVSSLAHHKGDLFLHDINYNEGLGYDPMEAYRRSKLANMYFAFELQRYFEAHSIDAISVVAHPGVVPTHLMDHTFSPLARLFVRPIAEFFMQKVPIGALAQIRAAVDPEVQGADFYGPSGRNEWKGTPILVKPSIASQDEILAQQLWYSSQEVTGCQFIAKKG